MVFPNFFITFVRHSFHTSPPLHTPSRERRHRPATRHHTPLMTHALPHAPCTRAAHRKRLCSHATHPRPSQHTRPPHYTPPQRAMPHALLSLTAHTPSTLQPPQRAIPRTRPRAKCRNAFPCSPLLSKKKERASTTKILHITILHVTFTRIGVKTTQKSEAIFSFID